MSHFHGHIITMQLSTEVGLPASDTDIKRQENASELP